MTALKAGDVDRFLDGTSRASPLVLIYGPDEGLVRTRVKRLITALLGVNLDPLSLVDLDADTVNADPLRLLDEANSISMFGDKRVIHVRQAGKLTKSAWQALLDFPPQDTCVIFQADELTKTSTLRSAIESSSTAIAIACYPPNVADIRTLIDLKCRQSGLSITPVARAYLTDLLGADFALSESEIEKLLLYCHGKLMIDVADIDAVITDSSDNNGSEPIDRAFEGKLEDIEIVALRSFREGVSASGLLVLALNHAFSLRRLAIARQSGNFDAAFRNERVFFRRQERIKQQAERWTAPMLAKALETLGTAQEQTRRNNSLEETITIRALWALALASRRR